MKAVRVSALRTALAGSFLALCLAACEPATPASGTADFAVLAQAAEEFEQARRGRSLEFPRDHGAHPAYRIEWWYLTANLESADRQSYGAQWTLFRIAVAPPKASPATDSRDRGQLFMAHFALTWPGGHGAWQRYARGSAHAGEGRAGVQAAPFSAWLDDWALASTGEDWLPLRAAARQDAYAMRLELDSEQLLVLQGDKGFSQKHPNGGGSHYYSQPFLQARGEIVLDGQRIAVSGPAWLDREWSSQFLQTDQAGWDWFALHLDSGEKLMLFQLRGKPGVTPGAYSHAVLIGPEGDATTLDPQQIGLEVLGETRMAGRSIPVHWRVELPQIARQLEIRALHPGQWMDLDFPYWEGAVIVEGEGPENRGRGYMELTGYPAEE